MKNIIFSINKTLAVKFSEIGILNPLEPLEIESDNGSNTIIFSFIYKND